MERLGRFRGGVVDLRLQLHRVYPGHPYQFERSLTLYPRRTCQGFLTGAAANVWLTDRLGFGIVCLPVVPQSGGRLTYVVNRGHGDRYDIHYQLHPWSRSLL